LTNSPISPAASAYETFADLASELGRQELSNGRPVVCVQGLGFVGAAMAAAVASACDRRGEPHFNVIGVDLRTPEGRAKVESLNAGRFPLATNDTKLVEAVRSANRRGNLLATTDERVFSLAAVTIVNVPLDIVFEEIPTVRLDGFRAALRTLGSRMAPGSLVIVETTVPPGTCEKVVAPELMQALAARGLPPDALLLAHSPERVMPGDEYFNSMVNFWRTYAGHTPAAADACELFLSKVVNVEEFPLTRLQSTVASETAKILENSYRATTIAFMEEWGRFAEAVGVDLFEVIAAIRRRPTHSNMRQPGFGVGGYCLTKDPLFAQIAARELFDRADLSFPFSTEAVAVNNRMPLVSLGQVQQMLGGRLEGKTILLMGVTYRQDVGDTRHSPAELFVYEARARGAEVICHDPLLEDWPETGLRLLDELPDLVGTDAIVFAVPHRDYAELDFSAWLNGSRPVVLDANNVLTTAQRATLSLMGCHLRSVGRGDIG